MSPRISLCVIARNEEQNLPDCLGSVADLVDEMIVVDTGSTDATRQIAERLGAKVFEFPWIDDFAAARNACLSHATGDWIFWLDADDRVDEENRERLRKVFAELKEDNAGYMMRCVSLPDRTTGRSTFVDHARLFRNHPEIRWQYRVHEQIMPAIQRLGGEVRVTDVTIRHVGYQEPDIHRRKVARNLTLLERDYAEHPQDALVLFNLGRAYMEMGRTPEALSLWQRSLQVSHPGYSIVRKLYALIARGHASLSQWDPALAACGAGRARYPDDDELLFLEASLFRDRGDVVGAETRFKQLFEERPKPSIGGMENGLRGFRTRHELALMFRLQKRFDEAETQWRQALAEHPNYPVGWLELGGLYLQQKRWDEAQEMVHRLESLSSGCLEANLLRVRTHLAKQDLPAARQQLEQLLATKPDHSEPYVQWARLVTREATDRQASVQAWRHVLAREPQFPEALQNLAQLGETSGLPSAAVQQGFVQTNNVVMPMTSPMQIASSRAKVSLCMIVKNEEQNLPSCLASVADLVDEIIVVDTGSTDRTKELAATWKAKIFDFPWIDDFAAARNESLRHATGDWILWLDADDRLDSVNRERLREVLQRTKDDNTAYEMNCQIVSPGGGTEMVSHVRLFRNRPDLRWRYRVHEQIVTPAAQERGISIALTNVTIVHVGYSDAAAQQSKLERNLSLLEKENADHPDDPFTLFNLGLTLLGLKRPGEAVPCFHRSLEISRSTISFVPKMYRLLVQAYGDLGQPDQALAACREGISRCPGDMDLRGVENRLLGRPNDATTAGIDQQVQAQADGLIAQGRLPDVQHLISRLEADLNHRLDAVLIRARLLMATRDFAGAKRILQPVMAEYPQLIWTREIWSHVLLREGLDWAGAEQALRNVLALNPNNVAAQRNLAVVQRRRAEQMTVTPPPQPTKSLSTFPPGNGTPVTMNWGSGVTTVGANSIAGIGSGRQRVSLCMIVRNEEHNLPVCLDSVADLVQEMIIVDTGSTDRTREIATRYGARVFDFPWIDDFSAARNESLRHATGEWILWLDADDRIDAENRQRLRNLLAGLGNENVGYMMQCISLPNDTTGAATIVDHVRLFRSHPQVRWKYRVHEQVVPSIEQQGGTWRRCDVVIQHTGYQEISLRKTKDERNLRLLHQDLAEYPDSPSILYHLGHTYAVLGRPREALPLLRRSLDVSPRGISFGPKAYSLLIRMHRDLGHRVETLASCREGLEQFPDDSELLYQQSILRAEEKDLPGAEASLLQLLQGQPNYIQSSVDVGLRSYKARHKLATIYRDEGRFADATAQWQAVLAERPDYTPAWIAWADMCLEHGKPSDLEQVIGRLDNDPQRVAEAAMLRSRWLMARREFTQARQMLEVVIARMPQAVWPRVLLSHVLLQEGRDWVAAERCLREILALEPNQREARSNLAALMAQRAAEPVRQY
jgi:glycosyltransferase involved in cell wall biosynthesis/thioredoxin-like negative regulator of GroEL